MSNFPMDRDSRIAGERQMWELAAEAPALKIQRDSALEALRPFARMGERFRLGGYRSEENVYRVTGPDAHIRVADCLRAADEWRKARPGVAP